MLNIEPWKRILMDADGGGGGGEPGNGSPGDGSNNPGDSGKTFDETYVKQLRFEAAQYRTKAKELEQKLQTMPQEITAKVLQALGLEPDPNKAFDKQLEEARKKAQEAEQRANERLIRAEVKSIAAEMGLVDADAALALMDKSKIAVKEDGTIEGIKEAMEALVAAKPWLKSSTKQIGGGTNPPNLGNQQIFTREQLKKMTPEEINANWEALMKQMATGGIK